MIIKNDNFCVWKIGDEEKNWKIEKRRRNPKMVSQKESQNKTVRFGRGQVLKVNESLKYKLKQKSKHVWVWVCVRACVCSSTCLIMEGHMLRSRGMNWGKDEDKRILKEKATEAEWERRGEAWRGMEGQWGSVETAIMTVFYLVRPGTQVWGVIKFMRSLKRMRWGERGRQKEVKKQVPGLLWRKRKDILMPSLCCLHSDPPNQVLVDQCIARAHCLVYTVKGDWHWPARKGLVIHLHMPTSFVLPPWDTH